MNVAVEKDYNSVVTDWRRNMGMKQYRNIE